MILVDSGQFWLSSLLAAFSKLDIMNPNELCGAFLIAVVKWRVASPKNPKVLVSIPTAAIQCGTYGRQYVPGVTSMI